MCLTLRAAAEEKTHPLTEIMGFQIKSSNFKLHFVTIGHFTVVYLVAKPLIWSEAEGDQYLVSMITK